MDEPTQDADLQSDEQVNDSGADTITVPDTEGNEGTDTRDQKEDPSDKLTPDHPRFKDVLNERNTFRSENENLRKELEETKNQIVDRQERTGELELTPEEQASLDRIDKGLRARGFVTESELQVQQNTETLRRLGERYTGKDGLPKFDRADIVAHAKKNGFGNNFEAAYRDMHFDAIVDHEAKAREKAPQPPTGEKPSRSAADGQGPTKKLTRAEIAEMSDEEYEKYREGLLQAVKPQRPQ